MAERKKKPPGVNPRETVRFAEANEGVVRPMTCRACGKTVLRGYVDALVTSLDLVPIDVLLETRLHLAGWQTFHVRRFGAAILATWRNQGDQTLHDHPHPSLVLAEHPCHGKDQRI
jgi:hypothetical protein